MQVVEKYKRGTYKVIASGTVGNDDIHYIREALASLPAGVLVELDLSQVTGLTYLSSAADMVLGGNDNSSHYYGFNGCTSLSTITLPNTITGYFGGFQGCTNLTSIEIPEGVTGLYRAFPHCIKLTEITIPKNVASIDSMSFYGCTSLSKVTILETDNWYTDLTPSKTIDVTQPESNAKFLRRDGGTSTESSWGGFNEIKRKPN